MEQSRNFYQNSSALKNSETKPLGQKGRETKGGCSEE